MLSPLLQDTGDMCVTIRVCNSSTSLSRLSRPKDPVVPVLAKTKESPDLCEICKTVLNYIKPYVDSNNSKEMVHSMLDGFCAMLNSSEVHKEEPRGFLFIHVHVCTCSTCDVVIIVFFVFFCSCLSVSLSVFYHITTYEQGIIILQHTCIRVQHNQLCT